MLLITNTAIPLYWSHRLQSCLRAQTDWAVPACSPAPLAPLMESWLTSHRPAGLSDSPLQHFSTGSVTVVLSDHLRTLFDDTQEYKPDTDSHEFNAAKRIRTQFSYFNLIWFFLGWNTPDPWYLLLCSIVINLWLEEEVGGEEG